MRSFLLLVLLFAVGCAHLEANTPQAQAPQADMIVGFRPHSPLPPDKIERLERLDSSCWYYENGSASCVYISRVAYVEDWLCAMGFSQDDASSPWLPRKLMCNVWDPQYQRLLDNPRGTGGDEKSDD